MASFDIVERTNIPVEDPQAMSVPRLALTRIIFVPVFFGQVFGDDLPRKSSSARRDRRRLISLLTQP